MYGREALRQFRERQAQVEHGPERQASLLGQIPPDAPMADTTLTVWTGERFVAWEKWIATAPLIIDEQQTEKPVDREQVRAEAGMQISDPDIQRRLWEA
jgi:hypothetical protein